LNASDFELFDRGVPQRITSVSTDTVPIDVAVLIDTSHSMYGAVDQLRLNTGRIASALRAVDQFQLIAFGTHVTEVVPTQRGDQPLRIPRLPFGAGTSFNDAVALAIMQPLDPTRRRLIVIFTDARDTTSVLSTSDVVASVHDLTSSVADALERVIGEFRSSYLPRFTPEGVEPTGWHELQVRVPKSPRYRVSARAGYFAGASPRG
jgi:uncharacterized protein (DUF58 family)